MTSPFIRTRRSRAEAAIDTYSRAVRTEAHDEALIDLLTDLMHWADGIGIDFGNAIEHAEFHHNMEVQL